MEDLVLTIEQCKYLKELGLDMSDAKLCFKSDGAHYYIGQMNYFPHSSKDIPTYTFQEILEKLPGCIKEQEYSYCLCHDLASGDLYYQEFDDYEQKLLHEEEYTKNEVLSAAYNMLCWVIENGYLKIDK